MGVSNEASFDPFSIHQSTIIDRSIGFRILFSKSMSHLRNHYFHVFLYNIKRINSFILKIVTPTGPQGMLVFVILIAFFLKRCVNFKTNSEMACKMKFWRNMMRNALTYEEWAHAAHMLDKETSKLSRSDLYDEEFLRGKLIELRNRRLNSSLRDIIFCMQGGLFRNIGNMCNLELHNGRPHMPNLIKEYIDEVSTQLKMICESDSSELLLEEKLAFMHETRHAFGRTALLLSGGASLGFFHVGVVKTLVEHKLLPKILSGSSAGSIICSIVATNSWPEVQTFFDHSWHSLRFFDQMGGIFNVLKRVMIKGAIHDIRHLQALLRNLTNNLTFQEAYDLTGQVLGITICSHRKHEPPRCLSYLTSPHVVIWRDRKSVV